MLYFNFVTLRLIINSLLYGTYFQEEIQPIPYSELTDLKPIGQGGFGVVYKAQHGRFGTVVYKELNIQVLKDRYVLSLAPSPPIDNI